MQTLPEYILQKTTATFLRVSSSIDTRFIAFDVSVYRNGSHTMTLKGVVHFPQLKRATQTAIRKQFPGWKIENELTVLSQDFPPRFAQVNSFVADMLVVPRKGTPLGSQVLFGDFVRCFFERAEYVYCQAPDGYLGWVHGSHLVLKTVPDYLRWINGTRARFITKTRVGNSCIPPAAELRFLKPCCVQLPDGDVVRVSKKQVVPHNRETNRTLRSLLKTAASLHGIPYLWGGKTPRGYDCSGFVQTLFALHNIVLPRDANQQANVGLFVGHLDDKRDLRPGDLVFFMNNKGKISHVGISLGRTRFVHASTHGGVHEASFDRGKHPRSRNYLKNYVLARRIIP
jgi:hypothetical protein